MLAHQKDKTSHQKKKSRLFQQVERGRNPHVWNTTLPEIRLSLQSDQLKPHT